MGPITNLQWRPRCHGNGVLLRVFFFLKFREQKNPRRPVLGCGRISNCSALLSVYQTRCAEVLSCCTRIQFLSFPCLFLNNSDRTVMLAIPSRGLLCRADSPFFRQSVLATFSQSQKHDMTFPLDGLTFTFFGELKEVFQGGNFLLSVKIDKSMFFLFIVTVFLKKLDTIMRRVLQNLSASFTHRSKARYPLYRNLILVETVTKKKFNHPGLIPILLH